MRRRWANSALLGAAVLALAGLAAPPAAAFVWPNVPERIARALASGDVSERRLAASRLAELPPATATKLVLATLGDPDVEVRLEVAEVAVGLRIPKAGDLVVPWLAEGDARLRLAACDVIRASPTDRSVVALGRVLGDPDAHVRLAAAQALGSSGLADAVSPLLGHLDDPAPEVRAEVARALGRIGDGRAVVPLVGKVQDSVSDVRKAVARALGDLADARAVSALMLALQDAAYEVRVEAVGALGKIRSDEATLAIAPLVEPVAGADALPMALPRGAAPAPAAVGATEVRLAALRALGRIGSEQAVKILVGALAKEEPGAQRTPARQALIAAGKLAVPVLIASLAGSPSANAAAGAALALGGIQAKEGAPAIVRAMQRGIVPLRFGLRALGGVAAPEALPTVLELIDDEDPSVRREAVRAAIALLDPAHPDGRAVDPASEVLASAATPLDEKIELVRLLGRTGAPRAQKVLLSLAHTKSVGLRLAVLEALGALGAGSAEVDAALLEALSDESPEVRLVAAGALARVGGQATARKLLERLSLAAEQDRGALGVAISGALARATDPALAAEVERALAIAPETARDALIEGLGRMRGDAAGAVLERLGRGSIDDRRKVAEALAGHPEQVKALVGLAGDADPSVRAGAAWSLGAVGKKEHAAALSALLGDPDIAVAGNAAAALGRVAGREGASVPDASAAKAWAAEPLCAALGDARAYVRANALGGLAAAGVRCSEAGLARDRLARDPSDAVRLAAADYLARAVLRDDDKVAAAEDRRALARCAGEDKDGAVASRCLRAAAVPTGTDDVAVFVVPDGKGVPLPRAPFALVRADGLMRLGVADRRGEVFERAAPRGLLRLAVPAPLAK